MRLLLINPNTSAHITERMAASARAALAPGDHLTTATASAGPPVVRDAAQLAQADANALALADAHAAGVDAIVLAISLDRAAPVLRERHAGLAVVGMTEGALWMAGRGTERVGLLTLGASLLPLYRERIAGISGGPRVVGVEAPEAPLAFAPDAARVAPAVLQVLVPAAERLRAAGAQTIVLAGAVLCGYAAALRRAAGVPVFDGVASAVQIARERCAGGREAAVTAA